MTETKIYAKKEQGVAAGKNMMLNFTIDFPTHVKDDDPQGDLRASVVTQGKRQGPGVKLHTSDDEKEDTKSEIEITGSWLGAVFSVNYLLKVFVKHDAWDQFGEGNAVQLPIKIMTVPKLVQSSEPFRVPEDWDPQAGCEMVYLYQ